MRFLKKIFNFLTVSIVLALALSYSLYRLQGTFTLIVQKDEKIKGLSEKLSNTQNAFNDLKLQHGALQTESRKREGELLKALQEAEDRVKQEATPALPAEETPTPEPMKSQDKKTTSPNRATKSKG